VSVRRRLDEPEPRPVVFWGCVLAGSVFMGVGLRGVFVDAERTHPLDFARWFVGGLVVHDFVFAPAVIVLGVVVSRVVPRRVRAMVQAALITSGVLLVLGVPLVRGYGERRFNPSHLPRNYGAGLLTLLAVVWCVAGLWMLASRVRRGGSDGDGPPSAAELGAGEGGDPVGEADLGPEPEHPPGSLG
jgi:hypothetical protein